MQSCLSPNLGYHQAIAWSSALLISASVRTAIIMVYGAEAHEISKYCIGSILSTTSHARPWILSLEKVVIGYKDGPDFPPVRGTWKSLSYAGGRILSLLLLEAGEYL